MKTITVSIRLPLPINKNVNKVSVALGMSKSAYIRNLIMAELKQLGLISKEIIKNINGDNTGK